MSTRRIITGDEFEQGDCGYGSRIRRFKQYRIVITEWSVWYEINRWKGLASPRYIFTKLNPLTSYIYPEADFPVLTYRDDDGTLVEPEYYCPIIPMVLVNGGKGIGTGFSYDIPKFNVVEIVNYLETKLREIIKERKKKAKKSDEEEEVHSPPHPGEDEGPTSDEEDEFTLYEITPYYEGFKGDIKDVGEGKYIIKGVFDITGSDSIQIDELPIGTWTDDYKKFLEGLRDKKAKSPLIKSFKDMSTDTEVEFVLKTKPGKPENLVSSVVEYDCSNLEKKFKLYTSKNTNNMNLFNTKFQLRKYDTIYDIIEDDYFPTRLELYSKRKAHQLKLLRRDLVLIINKVKFIRLQCDGTLDMRGKKKQQVIDLLVGHEFNVIDGDKEFKYLRNMTFDSIIEENIQKLIQERDKLKATFDHLKAMSPASIWFGELREFRKQYAIYQKQRSLRMKPTN